MISKLIVVHANGEREEEENSKDYLALHVYPNKMQGTNVLNAEDAVVRSEYSPDQTSMLYLDLPAD